MTHEQRVLEISCEIFRFYQFLALKCKGNFLRSEISSMSNVAVSGAFPRNKLFSFRTLGPWDMFIIPSFHPWQGSHWKLLQTRHCRHLDPVGCVSPGWQRLGKARLAWSPWSLQPRVFGELHDGKKWFHPRWGLLGDHVDELSLLYIFIFLQNGWTLKKNWGGWKFSRVNSAGKILR